MFIHYVYMFVRLLLEYSVNDNLLVYCIVTYLCSSDTQLCYYVYAAEDNYCTLNFGLGSMANSHRKKRTARQTRYVTYFLLYYFYLPFHLYAMIRKHSASLESIDFRRAAYDQHVGASMDAIVPVSAGSEIFVDYGEDWFKDRGLKETFDEPDRNISLSDLQSGSGQCLSHLYVNESDIPMAGKGVYSKISYLEGDTVHISPVLVLSKRVVRQHEDVNVLINYCISREGSDAALIPVAVSAVMNHGGARSNVRMEWYTGEGDENRLNHQLSHLQALPYAPLDIRYVATRPIKSGEELLLDYGPVWTKAWLEHLDRLVEWNGDVEWSSESKLHVDPVNEALIPQFREPIGAPEGFFPEHFKSDCISSKEICEQIVPPSDMKNQMKKLYEKSKQATKDILHRF